MNRPGYPTAPQARAFAENVGGTLTGSSWWMRRHDRRGAQLAHAVPSRVLLAYGTSLFTGGRLRITAECGQRLRTPDSDRFEIATAPDTLPDAWRPCRTCRERTTPS